MPSPTITAAISDEIAASCYSSATTTTHTSHRRPFEKQVGKIKCQSTYEEYCCVYNHLEQFIKQRYHLSDIAPKELTPAFITDFDLFLRTEKNCSNNTELPNKFCIIS